MDFVGLGFGHDGSHKSEEDSVGVGDTVLGGLEVGEFGFEVGVERGFHFEEGSFGGESVSHNVSDVVKSGGDGGIFLFDGLEGFSLNISLFGENGKHFLSLFDQILFAGEFGLSVGKGRAIHLLVFGGFSSLGAGSGQLIGQSGNIGSASVMLGFIRSSSIRKLSF